MNGEGIDGPLFAVAALCFAWLAVLVIGGLLHRRK